MIEATRREHTERTGVAEELRADVRRLGTPVGAKATDDPAMDDGWAQIALRAVVGGSMSSRYRKTHRLARWVR